MQKYSNPIIKGFNPDPSICRVDDTFYLVTSTFEFFPGVPLYKSKNLVDWECIGHCLTRASQLPLDGCRVSGGVYAPTIRYFDGKLYMVTTNVSAGGNFIVHSDDMGISWSEPVWIAQGGIDPSLLFADDKVYFVSNEGANGEKGMHVCEINPLTGGKYTESKLISYGCGGRYPEAPHLYKIHGSYYLMLAEGGTEFGHMVTIQKSDSPYGPFIPCPHNPILSHREEESMDIVCTGHGDMVEDAAGNWWMVALGVRTITNENRTLMLHNLGRETFLAPVKWENGWPIVGNKGRLALEMQAELPGGVDAGNNSNNEEKSRLGVATNCSPKTEKKYSLWTGNVLKHELTYIRNPQTENYKINVEQNLYVLKGTDITLSVNGKSPTFVGIRQKEFEMQAQVCLQASPQREEEKAGVTVFYNNEHHYDIFLTGKDGKLLIGVRKCIYDFEAVTVLREINQNAVELKIEADHEYYYLSYREKGSDQPYSLLDKGTTAAMCTEITRNMTFTGTFIGMFSENIEAQFTDFACNAKLE